MGTSGNEIISGRLTGLEYLSIHQTVRLRCGQSEDFVCSKLKNRRVEIVNFSTVEHFSKMCLRIYLTLVLILPISAQKGTQINAHSRLTAFDTERLLDMFEVNFYITLLTAGVIRLNEIAPKKVKVGQIAAFMCILNEGSNAEFSWVRNGHLLNRHNQQDNVGRMKIVSDEESSILKISNVQVNDAGNYTCVAKNRLAETRVVATLRVEGVALFRFQIILFIIRITRDVSF